MKFKGDVNIITDNDIVTTGKHIGSNLNTVIENIEDNITKLEGNVKFIYANGSVGGGGGGSSTTKWTIAASLGGKTIANGNVISLSPDITTYPLIIAISGGSASYYVTYSYGNVSRSATLNSDNNWRLSTNLELTSNGTISIEVTDNTLVKNVYADYITTPYTFDDITLVRYNGIQYSSNDIYIENARSEGLIMHSHFTKSVEAFMSYHWVFDNIQYDEIVVPNEIKDGDIDFEIDKDTYLIPEKANLYNGQLVITIIPTNQDPEIITKTVSFNLIPNTIYLKILPQTGSIYDEQVLDPYQYATNREIAIDCRIYKGANQNRTGDLEIITDEEHLRDISIDEGVTKTIKISFRNPGWKTVRFIYSLGGSTGETTKYLYCKQVSSLYNWFKAAQPTVENYYRGWDANPCLNIPYIGDRYIKMHSSDETRNILFNQNSDHCNLLINVGIQYNEINDLKDPIATFYNGSDNAFATIYQDKIIFNGVYSSDQTCQFFLNKESSYEEGNFDKYHLITISLASVWKDSNDDEYNEIAVYLDGKLEGAVNLFTKSITIINSVDLFPGNYAINHLDVSYLSPDSNWNRVLHDSDINYYYYTYKSVSMGVDIDDEDTAILNFLYDSTTNKVNYSIENDLVKVDSTLYDNVAAHCNVPTLVLQVNRYMAQYDNYDVLQWMNQGYGDTSSSSTIAKAKVYLVNMRWGKNKNTTAEVKLPTSLGLNSRFYIKLQGSSTMGYKSKNLTLGIEPGSDLPENATPVFSPNFKLDDASTFLHEASFTLKADVVDSSHTNNVAMGRFINDNNKFEYNTGQTAHRDIMSHVRQCLDGFPTLIYLEVLNPNGVIDTYFLGVYSFNLGRDSYFNLGYSDLSQLNPSYLVDSTDTSFSFTMVGTNGTRGLNPLDGFVTAEVQDNLKFWDFSQYDNSVLFQQGDENGNFMLGDVKTSAGYTGWDRDIHDFVRSVAGGGGYLFSRMGKVLDPVHDYLDGQGNIVPYHHDDNAIAYRTIDVVPSYETQYLRTNGNTFTPYINEDLPRAENLTQANLEDCIGSTDPESQVTPKLNYNSLAYYYTTCMAFGLVDSVQKNLTIKKWIDSFGIFFYDMDTCLGRNNSGDKSSYFCFSDYWKSNIQRYDEQGNLIPENDTTTPVARVVNNGCTIYRDYFPVTEDIVGYDIPSSYLFAIAKYTNCLSDFAGDVSYKSPQDIYALWRRANYDSSTGAGSLSTASAFVDRYFASNLAEVPDCLLNLNYRNKYLYNTSGTEFDIVSNNLHGKGIEEVRDWMNGRLRILDAYFNLSSEDINITPEYKEPKPTSVDNNPDIYIIGDIFGGDNDNRGINREGNINFVVCGKEYSPLIIRKGSSVDRYLLESPDIDYEINTATSGNQVTNFGGSQLWTSLKDVNAFIISLVSKSTFTFNTKFIDKLSGDNGIITANWNLTTPSVKEISLNSPQYEGTLIINDSFYNLDKIDISRSKISLIVDGSDVSVINASNLNGASSLEIKNCSKLTSVNLSNANADSCILSPIWTSNIDLSNNRIKELSVSGNSSLPAGELRITNNGYLRKLTFSKFNSVNLNNTSTLVNIDCNDTDSTMLKSFTATNCHNLTSVSLFVDGLQELNLSGCTNLTNLTLKGSDFSKLVKLNLYQTKVAYITFDNGTDTTCLDLSRFTNLATSNNVNVSYVRLGSNSAITAIKFKNSESSPVYLSYDLQGCTNLERIYGNISVNATYCFYGLNKFSIHGSNLANVTWHGQSVLNGTHVKHPKDITNSYYASGGLVTNLTFYTYASYGAFEYTKCTLFDYYYILSNLGNGTRLDSMFAYPQNADYGFFDIENGNNPDVRLFEDCGNVTTVNFCFSYNAGNHKIYLKSPSVSNGIVTNDDGLFSPLTSCSDFSGVFYSYYYVLDKYLFRRKTGNYVLTSLYYFNPRNVLNTPPSTYTWNVISNIISNRKENTGDLSGFFNNIPSLVNAGGIFGGLDYIDYSNIFKIPSGVTLVASAFTSTYAYCENFVLSNYFQTPENVQYLRQSFKMSSSPTAEYYVNMELNNNTFSAFTNIVEIGYGGTGSWGSTDWGQSCFNGFTKTIDPNEFPMNIFANNTKVEKLASIFRDASSSVSYSDLRLPGNLFVNNPRLRDVSGIFYNLKVNYELSDNTSNNFKNCTNLSTLDYAFAEAAVNSKMPSLSGEIPYKFFWHGESNSQKTYYGTNERTPIYDEHEEIIGYDYINVQPYTVYTKSVNSTIASMKNCFQHSNLTAYANSDPEIEYNPKYAPYLYYSEYQDGPFVENDNIDEREYTFIWSFDGNHFPAEYTPITKDNYEVLDNTASNSDYTFENIEIDPGGGIGTYQPPVNTYIAPPDLLRYCSTNANISGLFAYCGVQGWNYQWNGAGGYNQYGYGLTGRICPYMLKPIPNVTDLSDIFRCCKLLSYCREDFSHAGPAYMIPEGFFTYAKKVNKMVSMFEGTMQPQLADLSQTFKPITGTINISCLFYDTYWDGNKYPGLYTELYDVFNTHEISNTSKAFCITTTPHGENTDRVRNQMIKFSNMFDSKYSKSAYNSNMNYSDTFRGYDKIGDGDNERFGVKTLVDNNITNNYTL